MAPRIVAAPLPWFRDRAHWAMYTGASGLAFGMILAFEIGMQNPWFVGIGFGLLVAAVFTGLGLAYQWSVERRRSIRIDAATTEQGAFVPELRRPVAALIDSGGFRLRARNDEEPWREFCDACERLSIARPHTVMGVEIAARLHAIERPDYSMEPEPILGSGDLAGVRLWTLSLFLGFLGILSLSDGEVISGLMLLGVAAFLVLTSHAGLRDRFRILRWDEGRVVAGMGSFRDKHRRRFMFDDAVMIVQIRASGGGLFVRFIGAAGASQITFTDEHDPDFIKLWQRWNHPHPRPDLPLE